MKMNLIETRLKEALKIDADDNLEEGCYFEPKLIFSLSKDPEIADYTLEEYIEYLHSIDNKNILGELALTETPYTYILTYSTKAKYIVEYKVKTKIFLDYKIKDFIPKLKEVK